MAAWNQRAEIGDRVHALDFLAVLVELEEPLREHVHHHADGAALPISMEYGLVGLTFDRAEAVHPAHIVDSVHRVRSAIRRVDQAGPNHGIAGDQFGKLVFG